MHARIENVRTTIEIDDEQRAELLRLAAERRLTGFSELVREAIDKYLQEQADRRARIEAALALQGSLKGSAGERLESEATRLREHWR